MPRNKQIDPGESRTPEERHKEFSEENGRWNAEMEEALTELDELAEEAASGPEKGDRAPA